MEEATCPRCGAVFVPETSAGMCPHCSYNARTLFAKLRSVDKELVAIVLFLIFSLLVIHSVVFVGIALAQAWSVFTQKAKMGLHKPPIALNLETRKRNTAIIPISKPAIPDAARVNDSETGAHEI
jgi:hypothetical protein